MGIQKQNFYFLHNRNGALETSGALENSDFRCERDLTVFQNRWSKHGKRETVKPKFEIFTCKKQALEIGHFRCSWRSHYF